VNPTDELRTEVRELLDEEIPAAGQDTDTRFTAAQIDRLLTQAANVNEAAAAGWLRKAGKLQAELGRLEETQAGDERQKRVNLSTAIDYCLKMAGEYKALAAAAPGSSRSRLLALEPPTVL
jgi:hypothetical protein